MNANNLPPTLRPVEPKPLPPDVTGRSRVKTAATFANRASAAVWVGEERSVLRGIRIEHNPNRARRSARGEKRDRKRGFERVAGATGIGRQIAKRAARPSGVGGMKLGT